MQPTFYIVILIFVIGILAVIITLRQKKELDQVESNQPPQEVSPQPHDQINKQHKTQVIIAVIVGALVLAGIIAFVLTNKPGSGDGSRDTSFISYLPIWVAVFIPLLAKKKKQSASVNRQKLLIIAVILGILFVLGAVTFFILGR